MEGNKEARLFDFRHPVRNEPIAMDAADGVAMSPPPLPHFSLKGRTVQSLMRLMEDWHRDLGQGEGGLSWGPSSIRPLIQESPNDDPAMAPTIWEITELTSGGQLRTEGTALRHCVASYSYSCWKGRSRIWSLRRRKGRSYRSVVTVEVNPASRTIVQARGF